MKRHGEFELYFVTEDGMLFAVSHSLLYTRHANIRMKVWYGLGVLGGRGRGLVKSGMSLLTNF